MNLSKNENFNKDLHDLTLLNTQVAEKWECAREYISTLRKELGLPKGKYRSIAPALTEQFETDVLSSSISIKEITIKWNVGTYTVLQARKKLKAHESLTKETQKARHDSLLNNIDYLDDLANPHLNNAQIANKWNKKHNTVWTNRKRFGLTNFRGGPSALEIKLAAMLDSLNIVYKQEYKIGGFRTDFYLGFNFHIDVNGEWVHSLPDTIDRDKRKAEYLVSEGHVLYIVPESRLDDAELKNEIYEHFTSQVRKYLGFPWE